MSRAGFRTALLLAISAAWLGPLGWVPVDAEPLRVGDMVVDYDTHDWRLANVAPNEAELAPRGDLAREQVPMRFVRRPGELPGDLATTCRSLAREVWSGDLYAEPEVTPTELAGLPAVRLTLHTRCRNATPTGVIACMEQSGSVYAVLSDNAIVDCRAEMPVLFPDPQPLDKLLGTLRFAP